MLFVFADKTGAASLGLRRNHGLLQFGTARFIQSAPVYWELKAEKENVPI